ncbi:testisin-like [Convolutriloba macropyga]|uniref:testisin-like n=1 Tax=Convolutriloba macropyga TaxID=536237 RepID=UPI003F5281F0
MSSLFIEDMKVNLQFNFVFITLLILKTLSLSLTPSLSSQRHSTSLIINGIQSPPRSFFATIRTVSTLCGATVISRRFVITAARCFEPFFIYKPENISIEIGDFSDPGSDRTIYGAVDYFLPPDYGMKEVPENNLALVKAASVIYNWRTMALPICSVHISRDEMCETPLATCGMGLIDRLPHFNILPGHLQASTKLSRNV